MFKSPCIISYIQNPKCLRKVNHQLSIQIRANRSTTDAIYILQNSLHLSSKPLFLCFIDLKAAYDWINRDMLFKILQICLKSPILINILKAFYTGTSAAIKGSTLFFQTFTGCRQGAQCAQTWKKCNLEPYVFLESTLNL